MRILFAHDHKFCRGEDGLYYSGGQYPYRLWLRYLEQFDELLVAGRVRQLRPGQCMENLDLSSGARVSFVEIPNINSPLGMLVNRRDAERRITVALQSCDGLIVRGSEIGLLAVKIAERLDKPWAIEVVSCPFDSLWNYGSYQGKIYAPYAAYRTKRMIKKAPYAIYVTKEFLQRRYPCQGRFIGASDVQIDKSDEQVLTRRLKNIEQERTIIKIGLIGSLGHKYKGIGTAIEAFGKIKDRLPPFQFCILGSGDPENWRKLAVKQGVAENTMFCGTLPSGEAVNKWLDDIDVYIQPSFQEGLPRALVEAMNRGCPALGSSAGGIPELLDAECIHWSGDSKALASLLEQAIADKQWRVRQAKRNFRKAAYYDNSLLDQIRREFWAEFAEYCKKRELQNRI